MSNTIKDILEKLQDYSSTESEYNLVTNDHVDQAIAEIERLLEEAKPEKRINPDKQGYSAASMTHGHRNTNRDYFDEGFNGSIGIYSANIKRILK